MNNIPIVLVVFFFVASLTITTTTVGVVVIATAAHDSIPPTSSRFRRNVVYSQEEDKDELERITSFQHHHFQLSTCDSCSLGSDRPHQQKHHNQQQQPSVMTTKNSKINKVSGSSIMVVMIISSVANQDDFIIQFTNSPQLVLVSHLLTVQFAVELVVMIHNNDDDYYDNDSASANRESILRETIATYVPCPMEKFVPELLTIRQISIPLVADHTNIGRCSHSIDDDFPLDISSHSEVQAAAYYNALETILGHNNNNTTNGLPKVMVLQAANVGGQLLAEKLGIPSVVVVPHSSLPDFLIDTSKSSSSISWITTGRRRLVHWFLRHKESMLLTRRWMRLNRLRKRLGLLPLVATNPLDYFDLLLPTTTILLIYADMLFAPDDTRRHGTNLPRHAHLVNPLLPPSIPCHKLHNENEEHEKAIILVSTHGLSGVDIRSVLRGIAMARAELQSLVEYSKCKRGRDETHRSSASPLSLTEDTCDFAKRMANMEVVLWDVNTSHAMLPELLPTFVSKDKYSSTSFLELVSTYYGSAVAVISHCSYTESSSLSTLTDQLLLCMGTSNGISVPSSTETASLLVDMLMDSHEVSVRAREDHTMRDGKLASSSIVNGGVLSARIVDTIAAAQRDASFDRLRELVNERVGRKFDATMVETASLVLAFIALTIVLVIWLVYCLRLLHTSTDSEMTNPTVKMLLRSPSLQAVFEHLEELDWALLVVNKLWWTDHSSLHNQIDRFLRWFEQEPPEKVEGEQPRGSNRETPEKNGRRKRR